MSFQAFATEEDARHFLQKKYLRYDVRIDEYYDDIEGVTILDTKDNIIKKNDRNLYSEELNVPPASFL